MRVLLPSLVVLVAAPVSSAWAQVACNSLPNAVFVPGTTDVKPFLSRVAPKLATAAGADKLTVVYQGVGSCTAIDAVRNDSDLTGTAVYWTGNTLPSGAAEEASCTFSAGDKAHVALSDVTVKTCTGAELPAGLGQFSSMVQGFGFVAPESSTQQAITAEEGYFLMKFAGAEGRQVPPWTDPTSIVIRTPAASTQLLIGLAVGVPGGQWSSALTNVNTGSSAVVSKVAAESTTGNAEKTLGILSLQRYDENRDKLKMLAFQSFEQGCLGAVFPDSTETALDKRNLRDGHYSIWGYLWAVAPVTAGQPSGVGKQLIDFIGGTQAVNGADPIADAARAGAVPACAMKVKRAFDGAPLESHAPAEPCGCFYEQTVTGSSSCTPCASATCATGVCRFGFCEER